MNRPLLPGDDDCEDFGTALYRIRMTRSLTLDDFGKKIFLSKATIERWEKNRIPSYMTATKIRNIAVLLELSEEEFHDLMRGFVCTLLKKRQVFAPWNYPEQTSGS